MLGGADMSITSCPQSLYKVLFWTDDNGREVSPEVRSLQLPLLMRLTYFTGC
jgi:hypothetical protein